MKPTKFDFGGYATRHNVRCADGRVIKPNAFAEANGMKVPLVYQHIHNEVDNILGHAILETREDGVYARCSFNDSEKAQTAKLAVQHGDITALSIYANKLTQKGPEVLHGVIREVSLVLSGANPGAKIDNVSFQHGDSITDSDEDVIIHSGIEIDLDVEEMVDKTEDLSLEHQEKEEELMAEEAEKTTAEEEKSVGDVYNEMPAEYQDVVNLMVAAAVDAERNGELDELDTVLEDDEEDEEMAQSAIGGNMKHRVFDKQGFQPEVEVLSHDAMQEIFTDADTLGSLKKSFLKHSITNIEYLFPEARTVTPTPDTVTREMGWVNELLNAVRKVPFAKIKSTAFDLTADEARAKGYIKGHEKTEQVIEALKRETHPQTIYKKQSIARDDLLDITDFDVVQYMHAELRVMINEELARAILVGDGRSSSSADKINPLNIRPIWGDDAVYTTNVTVEVPASTSDDDRAEMIIDATVRSRKLWKGSGMPWAIMGTDTLTEMLLMKDGNGYRLYKSLDELASGLRVGRILEAEVLDGLVSDEGETLAILLFNPADYALGTNKGGEITSFEDFDIDYNQYKYLMETRLSGAMTKPKGAVSVTTKITG